MLALWLESELSCCPNNSCTDNDERRRNLLVMHYILFQVRKSTGKVLPVKYRLYMASEIGFTNEKSTGHIDTNVRNIRLTAYREQWGLQWINTAKFGAAVSILGVPLQTAERIHEKVLQRLQICSSSAAWLYHSFGLCHFLCHSCYEISSAGADGTWKVFI